MCQTEENPEIKHMTLLWISTDRGGRWSAHNVYPNLVWPRPLSWATSLLSLASGLSISQNSYWRGTIQSRSSSEGTSNNSLSTSLFWVFLLEFLCSFQYPKFPFMKIWKIWKYHRRRLITWQHQTNTTNASPFVHLSLISPTPCRDCCYFCPIIQRSMHLFSLNSLSAAFFSC